MPISQSSHVFNLVKSLTKAEKRNFKLYVSRLQGTEEAMFVRLFDLLDKSTEFREREVKKDLGNITNTQLSNLKRHLYSQILTSLRLIHHNKDITLKIREQLDFVSILYSKGLYMQSLKLLERASSMALDAHQDILRFEILEAQKMIEEKHITRSRTVENKVETLIHDSLNQLDVVNNASRLANLKLEIHGLYIQIGHAKDRKQAQMVSDFFYKNLPSISYDELSFFERIYLHQSYVWYYYILLDFEHCLEHSKKWVNLFLEEPEMIAFNPDLYMRGLHYCITAQFHLRKKDDYNTTLRLFQVFENNHKSTLSKSSKITLFLYHYYARIDYHILTGQFEEAIQLIPSIKRRLNRYEPQMDPHRILTFYYRFAWIHFATRDYDSAMDYLNRIINLNAQYLREDIQCYAWLLNILCHWEKRHFRLLTHLIESAARFFNKMKEHNKLQKALIAFIRKQLKPGQQPDNEVLLELRSELIEIRKQPHESKAFLYLDAIKWLDSKLTKTSISELYRQELKNPIHF